MAWTVEYDPRVEKDLKALDRAMQRENLDYMDTRIATDEDPRRFGKPLRHELRGLWRYRVRDYRIICQIREQTRVMFVLTIKHRSVVYD
ncbi:MAG TPA: type II toxin-antitoxin system RelE/ParE family toxin [Terriglobia bacterium]|nr:type II toxin-antitoxin system RelE/ParE family toxin [Terriglobia bacterium]